MYVDFIRMYFQDNTNPLWPQFFCALKLKKTILMPELVSHCNVLYTSYASLSHVQCLVLFAVYINVHRKFKAGTKQVLLGQNVFPLNSLKSGKDFIVDTMHILLFGHGKSFLWFLRFILL